MVYFFGTQICYCLTNYNEVWDSVWKKKKEKKEKISDRKKNRKTFIGMFSISLKMENVVVSIFYVFLLQKLNI